MIPATIGVTFITLRLMGQSFNLMTLGGLAAAVGLVIDDAIVVVENIVMHRDSGQSRAEAIRSAIREIRVPLVGSTITPIVVFLPLISITGVTGVFFRALAVTVGMALAHFAGPGAHLDADSEPLFPSQQTSRCRRSRRSTKVYRLGSCELMSARCASPWNIRLALALFTILLIAGSLSLLHAHRFRLAAGHGRGRIHRRLHHAARFFAARNQSGDQPRGKDPARHAGSRDYGAPHRPATRPGRGYGSEPGRHQRQAETHGAAADRDYSEAKPDLTNERDPATK